MLLMWRPHKLSFLFKFVEVFFAKYCTLMLIFSRKWWQKDIFVKYQKTLSNKWEKLDNKLKILKYSVKC